MEPRVAGVRRAAEAVLRVVDPGLGEARHNPIAQRDIEGVLHRKLRPTAMQYMATVARHNGLRRAVIEGQDRLLHTVVARSYAPVRLERHSLRRACTLSREPHRRAVEEVEVVRRRCRA